MNFEGLDPSLAEYAPPLHPALDPVLDPHLNPSLLQNVELDPEGVPLEGIAVPESVHLMEGMYSELHTAVSEVGVPVSVSHFDLHEEMLWVGNHGVGAHSRSRAGRVTASAGLAVPRSLPNTGLLRPAGGKLAAAGEWFSVGPSLRVLLKPPGCALPAQSFCPVVVGVSEHEPLCVSQVTVLP